MTEYRAAGVDVSPGAPAEYFVSNVFDTREEAEAFRDEHLEGAPATTWPSVTLPVPHDGRAAFIEKGAFPL